MCVALWRHPQPSRLFGAIAAVALAFFVLTTLQRERYMYPVLAPLVIAACYDRKHVAPYVVASVTAFMNMAASAAISITGATVAAAGRWTDFPLLKSLLAWHNFELWRAFLAWRQLVSDHPAFGAVIAALNLAVLIYVVWLCLRAPRVEVTHSTQEANQVDNVDGDARRAEAIESAQRVAARPG
jgi:hypothetical protein